MYQLFEDQAFFAKISLKAPVFVAGECWDRYRQHRNSCVSKVNAAGRKREVALYYLNWLAEYLNRQGIRYTAIWQAFEEKMWRYRHPILYSALGHTHHWLVRVKRLRGVTGRLPC
jgi:hypothetical protein